MTHSPPPNHFNGKRVSDHLKEARLRAAQASEEIHGTEMSGHLAAAADSAKNSSLSLFLLWIILKQAGLSFPQLFLLLALFSCGSVIWMVGRSANLGWARLERLHRLIEQERWEIEHHRQTEREELVEMYRSKGFTGKLLEEVVSVLMADDNRLLQVMVEEELGLNLEAYEHPLKQGFGAAVGALFATGFSLFGYLIHPPLGLPLMAGAVFIFAASLSAKAERNRLIQAIIWNVSVGIFAIGAAYFLSQILYSASS
ncbi:MAG: hypothetical protein A2Y28_05440 [Chlamydiae bacterium GWC2_50_10]|nr:MAG: hypothetical protein A2Z85_03185 [Chlamydiae bacterium GWA2_50_15]OGN54808.1 MAG: hypothetical protein A2Y28_05440 [Chlamydiae bacterium GWC2_50_10]OGN54892.1 MAG: hypothetical protein A2098_01690 [Chlamydiae bacterium GWF2_49_8]OGN58632.1 MAG: hypothetical protein A3D18_04725 [Chlamydiae bacterium RIFCSPHIGHO2_02_FULL_49_29]OGN63840.1 MAG: hypothetical protein A3E26_01085 [Chlamydiae bacterium RIFCSPHIGHO2_12_FULL_49_32]OGN70272.1 MAG: hypothetical protein A3I15_02560 [Chlamydiae bact